MPPLHHANQNLRKASTDYINPTIDFWAKERTLAGNSQKGFACIIHLILLEFSQFPPKGLSWTGKNSIRQIVSGVSKRVVDIRRPKRKSGTNSKKIRNNPSSKRASRMFTSGRGVWLS